VWIKVFYFHPPIHLLADALALPVRNAYAAILCFSPGGIRFAAGILRLSDAIEIILAENPCLWPAVSGSTTRRSISKTVDKSICSSPIMPMYRLRRGSTRNRSLLQNKNIFLTEIMVAGLRQRSSQLAGQGSRLLSARASSRIDALQEVTELIGAGQDSLSPDSVL
jgi:hypothetical protein